MTSHKQILYFLLNDCFKIFHTD